MKMTLQEFQEKVAKLPKEKQVKVMDKLMDLTYDGLDENIFRLMATSIKFAKENKVEGYEAINVSDKELEKLTHIQDGNRLIQKKK